MLYTSMLVSHLYSRVFNKSSLFPFHCGYQKANYAKKAAGSTRMVGGSQKKKKSGKESTAFEKHELQVETDPTRLVSYCCGANFYKTGEDPKCLDDTQYPEWLWELRIIAAPDLEEFNPNSKKYWNRIRTMALRQNNKLAQLKLF